MTPQMLLLIVQLVEQAASELPALVREFKIIFGQETPPTDEQWQALYEKIKNENQ